MSASECTLGPGASSSPMVMLGMLDYAWCMRLKAATATWASTSARSVSQPRLITGKSAISALLRVIFPREKGPESAARILYKDNFFLQFTEYSD